MNQNLVQAERWLAQAETDLKAAEWNLKGGFPETACFLTQQATEKCLKAALIVSGKTGLTSHSTLALLKEIILIEKTFQKFTDSCRLLDKFYVPTRYPDSLPSGTPHEFFTDKDAKSAIDIAKQIQSSVSSFIQKKENEILSKKK